MTGFVRKVATTIMTGGVITALAWAQDNATIREVPPPEQNTSTPSDVRYHPEYKKLVDELKFLQERQKTADEASAARGRQEIDAAFARLREYIDSGKPAIISGTDNGSSSVGANSTGNSTTPGNSGKTQSGTVTNGGTQQGTFPPTVSNRARLFSAKQLGLTDVDVSMSSHRNWNNANWGRSASMVTGAMANGTSTRRIFMKFDTMDIEQAGHEISSAILEFDTAFGMGTGEIEVKRVLAPWEAGTGLRRDGYELEAKPGEITWEKQPSLDDKVWASAELAATPTVVRFDITALVQSWISGEYPNLGLALVGKANGDEFFSRELISSDHPDESVRPRMLIEHAASEPTQVAGNSGTDELITTASGLRYMDIIEGNGLRATAGRTLTVHYTGWLMDGSKFDSSVDRGHPFTFPLGEGRVIKGWDEGVVGMKVGGKRLLFIRSNLAYGDSGAGGVIPPRADLKFEIELLKID